MNAVPIQPKGPWTHRFGVMLFTALAGILAFWLLGFVVDDIGELKGPQLVDVEKRHLDPVLVAQSKAIDAQIAAIDTQVQNQKARQALLRDSTTSSQQTMNQLLDMQKQNIQNQVKPSISEQNTLAQSESQFIANQAQYQALNQAIVEHTEEERSLQERKSNIESRLAVQREAARKEFAALDRRHHLRTAAFQLLFLIPLLLVAVYVFLKWRAGMYTPPIYAFGIATLLKVVLVIHENFPTRYFKYILLLALLAVVTRVLFYLIRAVRFPRMASLLKQYREAYERFLCPVCEYPIRRGPMKYIFWDRRTIRKVQPSPGMASDDVYACPSCGSALFEVCALCRNTRPSLLPFCDKCGGEKLMAS